MNRQLTGDSEKIVNEIKEMIPETAREGSFIPKRATRLTAENGDIVYGGTSLTNKVGELAKKLSEHLVEDHPIDKDWGWSIWHFPLGRTVINKYSAMYIIPLSDKQSMTPGGDLSDLSFRENNPTFNQGATVLIFMK